MKYHEVSSKAYGLWFSCVFRPVLLGDTVFSKKERRRDAALLD